MNFVEDEPRKVPKPVPFSENSIHPAVPEVSLIMQGTQCSSATQPNYFSGIEFQSYNFWRSKVLNETSKENMQKQSACVKKKKDFYPANGKCSGYDIEKRKNEILYGNADEPRRPLPPRFVSVIPECVAAFSDASFSYESKCDQSSLNEKKNFSSKDNIYPKHDRPESKSLFNELNDIRDACQIVAKQNSHMALLEKQCEQLLKSQDFKEKQIEQLLKIQEAKENKIEQLLKIQDLKENHIAQLLKVQEKQEKQIEQLMLSQEQEKQMYEISKQRKREVATVGLMAQVDVADKSTMTDLQPCCEKGNTKQNYSFDCTRLGTGDQSFTLHSLELPAIQEHAPTPQSSIHVDIPEYNGSSEENSYTSSETDTSTSESKEAHINCRSGSKPLGYTFYNNVLMQVNDIIQSQDGKEQMINLLNEKTNNNSKRTAIDLEKSKLNKCMYLKDHNPELSEQINYGNSDVDTLWGVSHNGLQKDGFELTSNSLKGINFTKDSQSPSDISLKMNALALKYLKQEQISQYEMQAQLLKTSRQPDVTIYNVTNLSFGTMRYLERHKISKGENGQSNKVTHVPHQFLQQKAKETINSYINS